MENQNNDALEKEQPVLSEEAQGVYNPRPRWQVWAARLGLIFVIAAVLLYYLHIARGGL